MSQDAQSNDIDEFFSSDRTSGRSEGVTLSSGSYREHLYELQDPVLAPYREMSYEEFTADRYQAPFLRELLDSWRRLYDEPYVGITTDGSVRSHLYRLPASAAAPPAGWDPQPAAAASALLTLLSDAQLKSVSYPIDAPEWRGWSNPEFVFFRTGLRLEDQSPDVVAAVHEVLRASLSDDGYDRVREAMELNGHLGELVELPRIMNPESYWFALFGAPGSDEPWGWQLFGHHVALNFVTVGGRNVIAPVFLGAEPALSDGERPPLFASRERWALELAESLTAEQRSRAIVFDSVLDPAMPEGRLHPADERHVAGAFRDNRVITSEGIPMSELDASQQRTLLRIVEDFLLLLRPAQRAAALAEAIAFPEETFFSWYGATDGSQPFYFRVHGPTILAELDHHAGVWLNNRLPARFHVHTTLRLPNGNDYGKAYLAQWREREAAAPSTE
ncbi:DUF3500 domain-containing protein [Leucobacter chromiireducens]|uniref:DUF3500 domain-containing protein n=1 Tax=Leucobacter chromiireducens subsp. solipictus TaxID=398235 RepID=A0ABS1SI30_9MICO|nr:DUF3500 domain-containing protein [Leucobacter chromiireducens]MBL3680216.1 DUF3500 domain-containing protein [Leucobacter chromiireducens subsp. solipictus]